MAYLLSGFYVYSLSNLYDVCFVRILRCVLIEWFIGHVCVVCVVWIQRWVAFVSKSIVVETNCTSSLCSPL